MLARPRRSILFLPGSNARAIEKSKTLDCDAIIFDLEDAVAPEKKSTARDQVLSAITHHDFGPREIIVRINALSTSWAQQDVKAMGNAKIDAIMLPKVEFISDVEKLAQKTSLPIWCNIETPIGVLNAGAIASHKQLAALVAGTNDLAAMLHVPYSPDRAGLVMCLSAIVLAARAHEKLVFDGTFTDIRDDKGCIIECRQGRALGFDGKTLIHPDQITHANAIFAPTPQEITQAQDIVATYMSAMNNQFGVTTAAGKMIEKLHYDAANRLLQMADAIAKKAVH